MNEPFLQSHETHFTNAKWQELNSSLSIGFTTRNGGVSDPPFHTMNLGLHVADDKEAVIANRKRLAKDLSFPINSWTVAEQVHGITVKRITSVDKGKGTLSHESSIKGVDGLITNEKGILCTAFFADCVPLYFFDPVTEYIGIAHAGWKGTVHGIAKEMVNEFKSAGVNEADLLVMIGPSISKQFYEVDEKVVRLINQHDREKTVVPVGNNRFLLDLKKLNTEILLQSGILRHNIDITNYCTFRDENLFFSHRRDQGKSGRMLGFIGFKQ